MALANVRRLALADLDDDRLLELVRHGEDLFVERKRALPKPPGFGAAVASFANTLGGWVLLGVDDRGNIHGFPTSGKLDLQTWLAETLRKQTDPLPPFVCGSRHLEGKQVVVVRVFESADSPHIVRGSGAVYVRTAKGKEPVDDHRTLLELARRGEEAEERARRRLRELPVVSHLLRAPDAGYPGEPLEEARMFVRAAPLTVTPALRDWPLTRAAAEECERRADALLPAARAPFGREGPRLEPFGRAIAAQVVQETGIEGRDRATVIADSGGVVAVELVRGGRRYGSVLLQAMLDDEILPLATTLARLLKQAEAHGRVAVDLWLVLAPKTTVQEQRRDSLSRPLHAAGELSVPADDDDIEALARQWHRELQRTVGVVKYEDESEEN
jgi:hypothetical protein